MLLRSGSSPSFEGRGGRKLGVGEGGRLFGSTSAEECGIHGLRSWEEDVVGEGVRYIRLRWTVAETSSVLINRAF